MYARHPANGTVTGTSSGSISLNFSDASELTSGGYGSVPFGNENISLELPPSSGDSTETISGSGTLEFNLGCNTTPTGFNTIPGVSYYKVAEHTVASFSRIQSNFNGTATVDGTTNYTVTLGADKPDVTLSGPVVVNPPSPTMPPGQGGGPDDDKIKVGASVTFSADSFDPDNPGEALERGICSKLWTVSAPGGGESIFQNQQTITAPTDKPGKYDVKLVVTDNEGDIKEVSKSYYVGGSRKDTDPKHKDTDPTDKCGSGGGGGSSSYPNVELYQNSGNLTAEFVNTGVQTRDMPLVNTLTINNHSISKGTKGFGNAHFAYGLKVITTELPRENDGEHVVVVDSTGAAVDFGPTSNSSPFGGRRVYSDLNPTQNGGWSLTNAGPLGSIHDRGNFSYDFRADGKLSSVTTPNGNRQVINYGDDGVILEVEDESSGKSISIEYDANRLAKKIISNDDTTAVTVCDYAVSSNGDGLLQDIKKVKEKEDLTQVVSRQASLTYNENSLPTSITSDANPDDKITLTYEEVSEGVFGANATYPGGASDVVYAVT